MHTVECLCVRFCSGRVWNISAQIRECCGDHCCVFENHDYFLSCLRRKSKRTPTLSLRELLCVCRCIHVCACAPVCVACMHICVASQCIQRNTPCVAISSLYRASPLSHVITESPTASHTSDKTQSSSELYSICVIRQKTGNIPTRVNLPWHSAKIARQSQGTLV